MHKALLSALLLAVMAVPMPGQAATPKLAPSVMAVVDVQRIMQESLASKSVQRQLEAQRSKFQNEIQVEENGLRRAEEDLSKKRGELATQEYADREQQLRQRFTAVEKHVQSRRKVLDQSFNDSMNAVREALLSVVKAVANERGANIVIVKQHTLWVDQPMDITDEVLSRLDKKLPKVDVPSPKDKAE